ncbi:MAG: glycosyltransferase family 9 protein [Sphingobacteriales bacterium]|nr:glycosyltransferase family 9 protein [Sphingobacteriales bacterium]
MKILVIRFSSIGDIVLTTPVIRCLKRKFPDARIDFLVKPQYRQLISSNPNIDHIIEFQGNISSLIRLLRKENYHFIIDLHKNIRSTLIRFLLLKPWVTFSKLNFRKWLMVSFKINLLPQKHLVQRYFEAVKQIGVENDFLACDFYFDQDPEMIVNQLLSDKITGEYYVIVLSGTYFTKRLPVEKISGIVSLLELPVILLGGKNEEEMASQLKSAHENKVIDFCGKTDIQQSAAIIRKAKAVLSGDTGMMHIAAALGKKVISVWGNTIPEFGMFPYYGGENPWELRQNIFEVKGLSCRPCSKLGKNTCPKKHFRCMNDLDTTEMAITMKNLN